MKYAIIALALFAVVHAASEVGQFVPRAVYTLDSEGHQSAVHPVSARLLRRLRRQVFTSSSSSSSTTTDSNGQVHFTSSNTVRNPDGTATFQQTAQHITSGPELASRFGDDSATSSQAASPSLGSSVSAGNYNQGQYNQGQYNQGQYTGSNTGSSLPHHTFTSVVGTVDTSGKINQQVTSGYLNSQGQYVQKKTTTTN
ncbi:hypothetical protein KR093_003302 [Drosophila rubida]|uniref:Uncharacterized protein n=1 Tax=Drosophila rubida TaxID=30044 RepID=A0AAD4JZ89_9MUSC|nr:hypothetical protein KR093_003302 [Drosophila rubida]